MELTDFIKGIQTASRKQKEDQESPLTRDYGINDNWPILLKTDAETAESYLESRGFSIVDKVPESMESATHRWLWADVVASRPGKNIPNSVISGYGFEPHLVRDAEFQRQNFPRGMRFYKAPYNETPEWTQILEEMVNLTLDFKEWAIREGVSFCFPFAGPGKNPGSENVVYHLATAQEKALYQKIMAEKNR